MGRHRINGLRHSDVRRRASAAGALLGLVIGITAVLAAPAQAAPVTTEAALRAAWSTDASVTLGASITLVDCSPSGGELLRSDPTDLTVEGNGFTITQTCAGDRVAETTGGTLTLADLTVTGGDLVDALGHDVGGGGIKAGGALVATRVSVSGNSVTASAAGGTYASGGGIWVAGNLAMDQSVVADNTVTVTASPSIAAGGGIYTVGGTIDASTIARNETHGTDAAFGGGLEMGSSFSAPVIGPLTLTNSTVTGNVASAPGGSSLGGGITTGTRVRLVYVTIADNSASRAVNVSADLGTQFRSGEVDATATVIAAPPGMSNCFFPKGYSSSLVYSWVTDATCGASGAGTVVADGADPQLGALGENGGPTATRLPASTSPLLDAVPVDACRAGEAADATTDQRGVTRPQGVGCDVGAVEVAVGPPAPPAVPAAIVSTPALTG